MEKLLEKYRSKKPEVVFEWNDEETGASGWVVINSLRNGAAGGGTRMRLGLNKEEVISLAKVMEIKFSVCGPSIGGAKSGINFDPRDPRRELVLEKWYKAVYPILKNYYGTGGDMNVDEIKDVIPITEELGLWHPQEGIVNGHFHLREGDKIKVIGQLRQGCAKIVEDPLYVPDGNREYAVADKITGYGVAESVKHFYDIYKGTTIAGKKVIIQGWGNVASAAGVYLALAGANVVGIVDKDGGIIRKDGMSFDEVKSLFINKKGNKLNSPDMISFKEANDQIWDLGADIFIPGAASKLVTRGQVDRMIQGNLEVMAAGANVPFVDDEVFFGPTARFADTQFSIIPDFIANCGMARVFAYLMQPDVSMTDKAIFGDVSQTIREAILEIHKENPALVNISTKALEMALKKLV